MDKVSLTLFLAGVEVAALAQLALGRPDCPAGLDMDRRAAWYLIIVTCNHLQDATKHWPDEERDALEEARNEISPIYARVT